MQFKMNINEHVKVKLTEYGIKILKARHDELNKRIWERGGRGLGEFTIKKDEEGYTTFQLWSLMNTFGDVLTMGFEIPFETDIIFTKGEVSIENLDSLIIDADRWMDDAEKRDDYNDVFYHEGKKHAYQHVKEMLKVR